MAFCTKCGTQLADGANFCAKCGTPVQVIPAVSENVLPVSKTVDDGVALLNSKKYNEAFAIFTALSAKGNIDATTNLALCYKRGWGVGMNQLKAFELNLSVAQKGFASAQFNLGNCYLKGEGVAADPLKAAEWFEKAAQQGLVQAQFNLGICYLYGGGGVKENKKKAVELFVSASEQGYDIAKNKLKELKSNNILSGLGLDPNVMDFINNI